MQKSRGLPVNNNKNVKPMTEDEMIVDPSNPQLALPFVSEEFWRVAVRDFESVFASWIAGCATDDEITAACNKYRYVINTRVRDKEGEPYNRANGATLYKEFDFNIRRVFAVEATLEEIDLNRRSGNLFQKANGDSPELIRVMTYKETIHGEDPDPIVDANPNYRLAVMGAKFE